MVVLNVIFLFDSNVNVFFENVKSFEFFFNFTEQNLPKKNLKLYVAESYKATKSPEQSLPETKM